MDATGSFAVGLDGPSDPRAVGSSGRMVEVIFPLHAVFSFVSSGEYHRLLGRAGRWGHRRLQWRLDVSEEVVAALGPGPGGNSSVSGESIAEGEAPNGLAGVYARGHNLTRVRLSSEDPLYGGQVPSL